MRPNREQMQREALDRAVGGQTLSNWPAIFAGFVAKGIPEDDIKPRENVFTYHAWRALGLSPSLDRNCLPRFPDRSRTCLTQPGRRSPSAGPSLEVFDRVDVHAFHRSGRAHPL